MTRRETHWVLDTTATDVPTGVQGVTAAAGVDDTTLFIKTTTCVANYFNGPIYDLDPAAGVLVTAGGWLMGCPATP